MQSLKESWVLLCSSFTNNQPLIARLWMEIEQAYNEPHRYYHGMSHISYLIGQMNEYTTHLQDVDTILFSIYYHDIIYDIKKKDNEKKSGELARHRLMALSVSEEVINKCYDQILASKDHKVSNDQDTNYFLDFDLAILGESPDNYKRYTEQVRSEYAIYPDFLYKKGRKKVLKHFLAMEYIFKTETFRTNFELQARANLKQELDGL